MKRRKVIIDCDPGVDDAVMLALTSAHQDQLEISGITTVCGNQDIDKVSRNALSLSDFFGIEVPVARGMVRPVVREPQYAPETHGEDGIGGCVLPETQKTESRENGILFMKRILKELEKEEKATIIATGPLTNVALLLRIFPETADKILSLIHI